MMNQVVKKLEHAEHQSGPFCVFLLLSNTSDRQLVTKVLPDNYCLSNDRSVFKSGNFDLLITDELQFQNHAEKFRKLQQQARPVLLPVLLLSKRQSFTKHDSDLLELVDDIVTIPTSPKVLESRINLLIKTRSYSKQLQEEKRKFELLAENATDVISTQAPDGTYTYVSPSSEQVFGYNPDELIGENALDFVHPEDRPKVVEQRKNLMNNANIRNIQFRKQTKSGGYKWVESIAKVVKDSDRDDKTEIHASTRDISDRKIYEHQLEKEVAFTDAILDFMPDIFFMVNAEMDFVRWNKNLVRKLGYSSSEMNNLNPFDLFADDDANEVNRMIKETSLSSEVEIEADMVTKGGKRIRHRITGQKFIQNDNHFLICSCGDISKQHRMMNELQDSNEEIQVLLKEIHHRVKNNLAVISGMLEMQSMESEDQKLQKELKDSQLRIQSIASIHELLYRSKSFSKIDMEKYLGELILKIQGAQTGNKQIRIIKNVASVELNINQAIPCALIANELITNAFKHAFKDRKAGKVEVNLSKKGNKVSLVISDDGRGLSDEVDFQNPNSLGIKLVNVLKIQLEAELEISSKNGSRFELRFSRDEYSGSSSSYIQ